jgi:ribonuclease BN (tRNA processing enzyme)
MRIRVLGCSGGISKGVATTSFLIDDDILIDAGTGVCSLTLDEMRLVKHVFLTHSHLDHIASLPLLTDTLFESLIGNPLVVHAQGETIKVLREHIFNWVVWPDFAELPHKTNAVLKFKGMKTGASVEIDGRTIEMITVNHSIPCAGFRVESNGRSFAFSGDTTSNENLWASLNKHDNLDLLFVESAFANKDSELASVAFHYCPETLAVDLAKLKHRPDTYISHLKPGEENIILKECRKAMPEWDIKRLKSGDFFEL